MPGEQFAGFGDEIPLSAGGLPGFGGGGEVGNDPGLAEQRIDQRAGEFIGPDGIRGTDAERRGQREGGCRGHCLGLGLGRGVDSGGVSEGGIGSDGEVGAFDLGGWREFGDDLGGGWWGG